MQNNQPKEGWRERFDRLAKEGRYFVNTLIGGPNLQRTKFFCEEVEKETEQRVAREAINDFVRQYLQPYFAEAGISPQSYKSVEQLSRTFFKHHYNITE